MIRRIGCSIALAAAAALLTLTAAEVALRLVAPQALLRDPDAFTPDPVLGMRLTPGYSGPFITPEFSSSWVINDQGHRGPAAAAREAIGFRIVALGDSFTFGYGVEEEESWPRLLEKRIGERTEGAGRIEVVNLGVGGYGTFQELSWLERKSEALEPDLAVLAFYVGNDPSDNALALDREDPAAPGGAAARWPGRIEEVKRWLGSRLHLFTFVSTRADELLVRMGLRQLVYPFEMEVLGRDPAPHVAAAWDATAEALRRVAAFGEERSLPLLIVVIPMKHQVSDAVWDRLLGHYGDESRFDRYAPQRRMAELLRSEGLESLDLLGGLRAAVPEEDGQVLYWGRDQHWNERGHAEAARLIADRLSARDHVLSRVGIALRDSGSR